MFSWQVYQGMSMYGLTNRAEFRTISINVHSTGVTFTIVVSVGLVWVAVVWTVIAAVSHVIAIVVVLSWVEDEWAVVLF